MKSFRTEGIVIKRNNYSEADRIVTIFTRKNGKIKVKASGVRRITSRRSPHIELLNFCIFGLYQGKSMATLTEVESVENFSSLKKDLKKIGIAYHLCELVDGLCPENQEHEDIFSLLKHTLNRLTLEEDLVRLTYEFEIELLSLLGFYKTGDQNIKVNTRAIIETILERKLKTMRMLPQLS